MKRVFVYARVSSNEQLSGGGFDRQFEACEEFANSKGWFIARNFREQESGSVEAPNRPLLSEAISLCGGAMDIDTIIVERADRIARDLIVSELFFRECRAKGIKVYAADCGEELVNAEGDPTRKLIRQVLGALAEWNKSEIVKKLQAGRRRTKEQTGRPCGGPVGYGYSPEEREVVRDILAWHDNGKSTRLITRILNRGEHADLPRPGEGRWAHSTVAAIIRRWIHRTA